VPVGQEHSSYVFQTPADAGEEDLDTLAREAGVYEKAAVFRLYVRRVARATAREDTQSQIRPSPYLQVV
jgi:hypothetical protein